MSQILGVQTALRPKHAPKAVSQAGNFASYAVSGLLFTALLTSSLVIATLLSLARLL